MSGRGTTKNFPFLLFVSFFFEGNSEKKITSFHLCAFDSLKANVYVFHITRIKEPEVSHMLFFFNSKPPRRGRRAHQNVGERAKKKNRAKGVALSHHTHTHTQDKKMNCIEKIFYGIGVASQHRQHVVGGTSDASRSCFFLSFVFERTIYEKR